MFKRWEKMPLKEVIELKIDNRGRNPENYLEVSNHPVIDNYLIKNQKYPDLSEVNRYIDKDTFTLFLRGYLEKDDVLITLVGNGIGNVTMTPNSNCVIIQNTLGLRCNEKMTNDFLYYALLYNQKSIKNFDRGSSQPSIRKTDLFSYQINVPSIIEQNAITKILSSLDHKIEINNKIIANLEEQAQAIFTSWFVDFEPFQDGEFVDSELGLIPKGMQVVTLKDISTRRNGYTYKSVELRDESNVNMLTLKSFNRNGGINFDSIKPIIETERMKDFHFLNEGDILIACTDLTQNAEVLGRAISYLKDNNFEKEIYSMDLVKIEPKKDEDYLFIYSYLKSSVFKSFAEGVATGTTVLHLPKKSIDDFKVVYPNDDIIEKFTFVIEPILSIQNNLIYQNEKLSETRDTLLPKLMSGEIQVGEEVIEA